MKKISLFLVLLVSLTVVLAACGEDEEPTPAPAAVTAPTALPVAPPPAAMEATKVPEVIAPAAKQLTGVSTVLQESRMVPAPTSYGEAPMLSELVAQGKLPPVEERLPSEPLVLQVEEVGKYGGIIRRAHLGPADANCNVGRMNGQGLARWSGDGLGSVPMAFSTVDTSADGNVWTVHLLPGMKWSDGAPFTADDFLYKYEVLTDRSIGAPYPVWIKGSGDPVVKVLKVDDSTVEFRYSQPYYLFWLNMSLGCTSTFAPFAPAHYLKQFNANYNPDAEKVAKAAGFETWEKYYLNRYHPRDNPDRPAHSPFRWTTNGAADIIRLSRNPYYQYVDQEGNQLPYVDGLTFETAANPEVLTLRATQGEIDFQGRHLTIANFPVLKEGEEKGGYTMKLVTDPHANDVGVYYNQTFAGPEKVFIQNLDWRIAMSESIDRESINETTFAGQATIRNPIPASGHPYNPGDEYNRKYATYLPDKSRASLAEIMGPKDSDGFFTLPDESRFEIVLNVIDAFASHVDVGEQVCGDFEDVFVRCTLNVLERSLWLTRSEANEHMITMTQYWDSVTLWRNPSQIIPVNLQWGWAPEYSRYYVSEGKEGTKPPPEVQNLIDIFNDAGRVPHDGQAKIAREIYTWLVDNNVISGVIATSGSNGVQLIKDDLVNVPDTWAQFTGNRPFNAFPEQLWFRSDSRRQERPK